MYFIIYIFICFHSSLICGPSRILWIWRILHLHPHLCAVRKPLSQHLFTVIKPHLLRRKTLCTFSNHHLRIKPCLLKFPDSLRFCPCRFVTPNHKSDLDTTPRTPTPFKNAMEKYGPLRPLVRYLQSMNLHVVTSNCCHRPSV